MKHTLECQEHLTVRQGQVVDVRAENGAVRQVVLATGAVYDVRAVILATGTYLKGRTIIGTCVEDSGPDGMHAADFSGGFFLNNPELSKLQFDHRNTQLHPMSTVVDIVGA